MAKCTVNVVDKEIYVKQITTETEYVLHLTPDEAQTLRLICSKIGGSPAKTPRGFMDSIADALDEQHVNFPEKYILNNTNHSIYFDCK